MAKGEEKEQESAGRKEEGHRKERMRQEDQRGWGGVGEAGILGVRTELWGLAPNWGEMGVLTVS